MEYRKNIAVDFPAGFHEPVWPPFRITDVSSFADWLQRCYDSLIVWTGYDPSSKHGNEVLVFQRFRDEEPIYDPNSRKVNLKTRNASGKLWFDTIEFFGFCAHEMAHDFTRWDEDYCQKHIGIEQLTYSQYASSPRKESIDRVVESLCEYFKKRLIGEPTCDQT